MAERNYIFKEIPNFKLAELFVRTVCRPSFRKWTVEIGSSFRKNNYVSEDEVIDFRIRPLEEMTETYYAVDQYIREHHNAKNGPESARFTLQQFRNHLEITRKKSLNEPVEGAEQQ